MKVVSALLLVLSVYGSHFRYGTIRWNPTGGNSVVFSIKTAWRRNYDWIRDGGKVDVRPGNTGVSGDQLPFDGDVIEVPAGSKGNKWYFGDGTDELFKMQVTSPYVNSENDLNFRLNQFLADSIRQHSYNAPINNAAGEAWIAGFFGCCRLSARPDGDPSTNSIPDGLNNNGYYNWDIMTHVDLTGGPGQQDNSPFASGRPILRLRMDFEEEFDIVAVDPDGDDLTWSMGTAREMGDVSAVGGYNQPGQKNDNYSAKNKHRENYPGYTDGELTPGNELSVETIMIITNEGDIYYLGEAIWDTNGLQTGFWQSTIMIEGNLAKIPYDFLMYLQDPKGNEPPVWIDPTPGRADVQNIFCEKTLTYTIQAEDSLKGREMANNDGVELEIGPDEVELLIINVPPQGLRHSKPEAMGTFEGAPLHNPTLMVASWTPACAQQGTYIVCYQPTDNHKIQPLDGRVRCVVITVSKVVNTAPYFIPPTPRERGGLPRQVLSVCSGDTVSFEVRAKDDQEEEEITLDLFGVPEDAFVGELTYHGQREVPGVGEGAAPTIEALKNDVSQTVTWTPPEGSYKATVCYMAREIKKPNSEGKITDEPLANNQECVDIHVLYKPYFEHAINYAKADPMTVTPENGYTLRGNVGKELSFAIVAVDPNMEDTLRISMMPDEAGEPLPDGLTVAPDACTGKESPEGVVLSTCNPVTRIVRWTAVSGQEDKVYKICFQAADDKDTCEEGGAKTPVSCVSIEVLAAEPMWVDGAVKPDAGPTPYEDELFHGYVGCLLSYTMMATDKNQFVETVVYMDGGLSSDSVLPEGGTISEEILDGLKTSRVFAWRPSRGQEAFDYKVCFFASDLGKVKTIKRCINHRIIRCKYCVQPGESLMSVAAEYELNWLSLYNVNVDVTNPDNLGHEQRLNLCPTYHVRKEDTLDNIAVRFHTTPAHILSMNPDIENADHIEPGIETCICPNICDRDDYSYQLDR